VIIVANTLITLGTLFFVVSSIGLITLPDFYTRAHAVAKSETFAVFLLFLGLLFRPELDAGAAVRLVAIILFMVIANPTAVHALVRAAIRRGITPIVGTDETASRKLFGGGA
jgi:multicomponent Na+:H+ antiporter subunit G